MKQFDWNAGALALAADRRRPVTDASAEVNVCAGNPSTLNPFPWELLTRE